MVRVPTALPGVTVVLPVHNARPYLESCLDSLAGQSLPPDEFEIVAVDDGSTDGSGALLDAFAAAHENVRVIHQEHSGWPGQPRNVATDAARGEFVFYLDADDILTRNALTRMLGFAREHGSDIVVVCTVTFAGERVTEIQNCGGVKVEARLTGVFRSLTAHKLIRRSLLVEHGIRFPEGVVTYEDGLFLAEVVPRAGRISTLGDELYYFKRQRKDSKNISRSRRFLGSARMESILRIMDTLRALHPDQAEVDDVAFMLHRRLLGTWNPRRFRRLPPEEQERLVALRRRFIRTHVPAVRNRRLAHKQQLRSLAFASGSAAVVRALARYEQDPRPTRLLREPRLLPVFTRAACRRWAVSLRERVGRGRGAPSARAPRPGGASPGPGGSSAS